MFPALASRMAFRRRALPSRSPPPERAATVISLMNFVNNLPRLASRAPFLCLILCHFECPDICLVPSGISALGCQAGQYITGISPWINTEKAKNQRSQYDLTTIFSYPVDLH